MNEAAYCPYNAAGFSSRDEYLEDLAASHGLSFSRVKLLADLLGPSEDFDGLVTSLEDGFLHDFI